jgi:hypothetical protein
VAGHLLTVAGHLPMSNNSCGGDIDSCMKFKRWLEEIDSLGCGLNGCAYDVGGDTVVKVTKNRSEADIASWLVDNPHSSIAKYVSVTDNGGSWVIVMEKLNTKASQAKRLEALRIEAEEEGCEGAEEVTDYLSKHFRDKKHVKEVVSAIRHVLKFKKKLKDFLNPNNMGTDKKGDLKLFDFQ